MANNDMQQAGEDAQLALLKGIKDMAENGSPSYAQGAAHLAEAYAWLRNPSQPHGGSTSVKT